MSPRSAFLQLITKASIGFGALFLVGVVLAAIPNHRPLAMAEVSGDPIASAQQAQAQGQAMDHSKMPGMSMDMDDAKTNEAAATHDMAHAPRRQSAHAHDFAAATDCGGCAAGRGNCEGTAHGD